MARKYTYKGQAHLMVPRSQAAVTPDDDTDLSFTARALWVGTGGDVNVVLEGDADDTGAVWKNVPDGTLLEGLFTRVKATSTTASNIIALF